MLSDERLESIRGHLACTVNPSLLAARALLDEVDRLRADILVLETLNAAILGEARAYRARNAELVEVLRGVEWIQDDGTGTMLYFCPACHEYGPNHAPDCSLDAALRGEDGE